MPPILNAQSIAKSFGATPLFRDISFTVSDGDRIGLIGPNGSGKSTLLGILSGQIDPDAGEVAKRKLARVVYVAQTSEFPADATPYSIVRSALQQSHIGEAERDSHSCSNAPAAQSGYCLRNSSAASTASSGPMCCGSMNQRGS